MKARSYSKKNKITEAKKLYKAILKAFPKNIRAIQGLAALSKPELDNTSQNPPQEAVSEPVSLYNQGQIPAVIKKAQALIEKYPNAFIVWNILGVSTAQIGMPDKAIEAYKKTISLKPDFAEPYYNMGNVLKNHGKLDEAVAAYNKAILLKSNYIKAYNNMGLVLQAQGKFDEAMEAHKKSISLMPNYAKAYLNIGNVLSDQGIIDQAIVFYNRALSIRPDYAEAYNNMGLVLQGQGKVDEAIEAYNKSISLNPDSVEAYINLGITLQHQRKLDEAIEVFKKAISLKPDYAETYNNLGTVYQDQHKLDDASEAYKKAISLKPDYAEFYFNIGVVLKDQGKLDKAIDAYHKALSLKPDYSNAYNNMGVVLGCKNKLDEAIEAFNKALSLNPNYAEVYTNMGVVLLEKGMVDKAIEAHKKSIALKPDFVTAHHNLMFPLLNSGKLKEGLDENEWRWKTDELISSQRHFLQPIWDGKQSLNGKRILLWSEQGIGDTLNWSSCIPLITSQAKHCILECPKKLVALLKRSFPNVEVKAVNISSDLERDDFDFHLPMGSLYKHFIPEITQKPKPEAYLVPDPIRINYWKERLRSLGKGPYIGVCWKSSVVSSYRLKHYPPISEWLPVFAIPDVTFINLQYSDFEDDLAKVKDELGITVHHFEDLNQYDDVDDVAALCNALDIAVTTKVTPMILTSAVGTPTKIANWQQSTWNNILTNPVSSSVDMFEKNTWEPWDKIFNLIAQDISKQKDSFNYF